MVLDRSLKIRVNGDIRGTPHVRVVAVDGEVLGVMTLAEALRLALKHGLDLVEVNPRAEPPVCKLLDFDKYKSQPDDLG
jgi:translation initiation factor IF-3